MKEPVRITIWDQNGKEMEGLDGDQSPGIHRIVWNTSEADPGEYSVSFQSGKISLEKTAIVQERWLWPAGNKANDYK